MRPIRIFIAALLPQFIAFAIAWSSGGVALADATNIGTAKLLPDDAFVSLVGKTATTYKSDFSPILPQFAAGAQVGTVQSAAVNEASGLAASRKNTDVLWVHNDSGDSARVFAMSTGGKHLGIYNLSGVTATDWEDMALGPGPVQGQDYLYMGDIGDNNAVRSSIKVYRVAEPAVSSTQSPVNVNLTGVETFTCQYEDGARDAETLMVDSTTGDLYIVSKREIHSRVYRAPASSLINGAAITLNLVAQLPWGGATAGDITPQGDEIAIRGYFNASVWSRPPGTNLWDAFSGVEHTAPWVWEPQGESIAYDASGQGYYTTSEKINQPIYYFARIPGPGPAFFYIEEPSRCSGIRVAASPGGISGLMRGSVLNIEGNLGTTAQGERQIVSPTVAVTPDPLASLAPLGMNGRSLGGGDFGDPPLGQYGVYGGVGLNNVGLLIGAFGRVSATDFANKRVEITDGAGVMVRVDTTALRTPPSLGQYVTVVGIMSLDKPAANRLRLIMPRSDADVTWPI